MKQLIKLLKFELIQILKLPGTWIYFLIASLLLFLVLTEIIDYAQTIGGIIIYSPMTIADIIGYSNKTFLILIAFLTGNTIRRDPTYIMDSLTYTTGINKFRYLFGKFLAVVGLSCFLLVFTVPLLVYFGIMNSEVEPAIQGVFSWWMFVKPYFLLTLPNTLFATTFCFLSTVLLRHQFGAFIGVFLYFILIVLGNDTLAHPLASTLTDPSGTALMLIQQLELSPLMINIAELQISGDLLYNRIFWLMISFCIWFLMLSKFKMQLYFNVKGHRKVKSKILPELIVNNHPAYKLNIERNYGLSQILSLSKFELNSLLRSRRNFLYIIVIPIILLILDYLNKAPLGFQLVPRTEIVLQILTGDLVKIFIRGIILLFSAYLVWRMKDAKMNDLINITPISSAYLFLVNFLKLLIAISILMVCICIAGILYQAINDSNLIVLSMYAKYILGYLFVDSLVFGLMCIGIQIIIGDKFISLGILFLILLYTIFPGSIGIEHKLLIFGSDSGISLPSFQSLYTRAASIFLYKIYWLGWACLVGFLAILLYRRERTINFRERLKLISTRCHTVLLISILLIIILSGTYIFYNTNILNSYNSSKSIVSNKVLYEKNYHEYSLRPQLTHVKTTVNLSIREKEQSSMKLDYTVQNKTRSPISEIYLTFPDRIKVNKVETQLPGTIKLYNRELGFMVYSLQKPLNPKDTTSIRFNLKYNQNIYSNKTSNESLGKHNVWISSWNWIPKLGYDRYKEIVENNIRKKYDLPLRERRAINESNRLDTYDREKIQFEAFINAPEKLTIVTTGELKQAQAKGRRKIYHFKSDSLMRNMFQIYGGNYKIKSEKWKNIDLRIYYLEGYDYQLSEMINSMKASLDYYSKVFGNYPYNHLSLVQSPDPGIGGISLPGTIGYSSKFSLLDNKGKDFNINYTVIAHEIAHQWWGNKMIPANMEGDFFLSESIAWYSAMGVIEKGKGKAELKAFLDAKRKTYLNPRSKAAKPLLMANNYYLAFEKGPLAMYALKEYLGEETINHTLRNLLNKYGNAGPPYPSAMDFYDELTHQAPEKFHQLISDLLKKNVYWNLRVNTAEVIKNEDATWTVTFSVNAGKVMVDETGSETVMNLNDFIEIGVYNRNKNGNLEPLILEKKYFNNPVQKFTYKVKEKPVSVGIDPRNLLIDTEMENNTRFL